MREFGVRDLGAVDVLALFVLLALPALTRALLDAVNDSKLPDAGTPRMESEGGASPLAGDRP